MKKTLFSGRLYLDGIKQLRIIGILFTALTSLVAMIIPIMRYLESLNFSSPSPSNVTCYDMNPLIILLFCGL